MLPEELMLRWEGNLMGSMGLWGKAIETYGKSIQVSLAKKNGTVNDGDHQEDNLNLVTCYSNRADAWLKLNQPCAALRDARKALELDKSHLEALKKKADALFQLKLFQEAVEAYGDVVARAPPDQCSAISRSLRDRRKQAEVGRLGILDLTQWWPAPNRRLLGLENLVRPVEIGLAEGMREGLFASEDMVPGHIAEFQADSKPGNHGQQKLKELLVEA